MIPRLKEKYKNEIIKNLMSKLNYKNAYAVPKIEKVVINMGLGADASDQKKIKSSTQDISAITGQHPIVTKFKKSISNFKSRKGASAGLKVTLRNNRMYEFIDRMINIALPRIKDFKGLKESSCDKFGNFSFGIKEHIIFPEINFDKVDSIKGLDVTIVTTSKSKEDAIFLLKEFNFPIIKNLEKKVKKVKKVEKVEKIEKGKNG
jgi:large subunit ribosomal protein L5